MSKCSEAYQYLFYKFYRWSQKVNSESGWHEDNAVIMVSFMVMINLFTIPAVVQVLTGYKALALVDIPKIHGVWIAALIYTVNYSLLKYKIGYSNIIEKFEGESAQKRRKGNIIVVCYFFCSFIVLFASWVCIALRVQAGL